MRKVQEPARCRLKAKQLKLHKKKPQREKLNLRTLKLEKTKAVQLQVRKQGKRAAMQTPTQVMR